MESIAVIERRIQILEAENDTHQQHQDSLINQTTHNVSYPHHHSPTQQPLFSPSCVDANTCRSTPSRRGLLDATNTYATTAATNTITIPSINLLSPYTKPSHVLTIYDDNDSNDTTNFQHSPSHRSPRSQSSPHSYSSTPNSATRRDFTFTDQYDGSKSPSTAPSFSHHRSPTRAANTTARTPLSTPLTFTTRSPRTPHSQSSTSPRLSKPRTPAAMMLSPGTLGTKIVELDLLVEKLTSHNTKIEQDNDAMAFTISDLENRLKLEKEMRLQAERMSQLAFTEQTVLKVEIGGVIQEREEARDRVFELESQVEKLTLEANKLESSQSLTDSHFSI